MTGVRAAMPAETLLEELIGDGSSDYADGDHPGYFLHDFDATTGRLTIRYEPDDTAEPEHAATVASFQLVGLQLAGLGNDEPEDEHLDDEG